MRKILIIIGLFLTIQLSGQILPGVVASQGGAVVSGDYPSLLDDADTEAWYSAEEENVTLDASDSLTAWQDRTSNNRDLGMEGAYQAFWDDDGVHMLDVGDASSLRDDNDISKPLSIYLVFQQVTWTSQDEMLQLNSNGPLFKQYFTGTRTYVYDEGYALYVEPSLETWVIVTIVLNGESSLIQMNANNAVTGTVGTNNLTVIKLGGIDVIIKELIIRSTADDATNRATIRNYLNDKYNIY